ncbi:MAG: TetR/AcrR family transcriptional regulator [Thermodesulfobacteriota bacterium]
MPKETFNQIADEKRERILDQAARLFAQRGLNQTDMSELAARAGVAKGSLYNYFKSKDELYLHVCRQALARSREAVYGDIDPTWDIHRQVEHIFRRGVQFALEHPEYVSLYLNTASAGMERFARKISREVEKHTANHLKRLLRQGMKKGLVRADLDVNLAAFLINSLYIVFIVSLVSPHFQIRMSEYLDIKGPLDGESIDDRLTRTIAIIQSFLKPAGDDEPAPARAPRQRRN